MNVNREQYFSKVLLFGEYTLLLGSKALITPFHGFSARLECGHLENSIQHRSNKNLRGFFEYLLDHHSMFPPELKLNLEMFESDLDNGLYLNSSVPEGYGVGSSGIVVAAIFDQYNLGFFQSFKMDDLLKFKFFFSFMESYFHGKSSGIDPLSCYVGKPLLISSNQTIGITEIPSFKDSPEFGIFLLDTGKVSKTENLVQNFLSMSDTIPFREVLKNLIIPLNNQCINALIKADVQHLLEKLNQLSRLQFEHFKEMIPIDFRFIWENGFETGDYSLKLCGSGGGGFVLGFTGNYDRSISFFNKKGLKIIRL